MYLRHGLFACSAGLVACSLVTSFDGLVPGSFAGADGGASSMRDAPASADANTQDDATTEDAGAGDGASGADAAEGSDLLDDGFEGEAVGKQCAGWTCAACASSIVAMGRDGGHACEVCLNATSNAILSRRILAPGAGNFTFDAYLLTPDDAGLPGTDGGGFGVTGMYFYHDAGAVIGAVPDQPAALVPQQWLHAQATTTSSVPASALMDVYIKLAPESVGDCFYVDDVRVYSR